MSYTPDSPLVTDFILSGTIRYRSSPLTAQTLKITPHHAVYVGTAKRIAEMFVPSARLACPTYCIGTMGDIVQCVPEAFRPVTSSNSANDDRAITFELANSALTEGVYPISDETIESFINICVDICRRYGVEKLTYDGTKNGSVTRHNMFAATTCPGPYLQEKLPAITAEINKRLEDSEMPIIYEKLTDVPESYRPTIQKLMEREALVGHSNPDPERLDDNIIKVDETYCRIMTTLDRMGKLD